MENNARGRGAGLRYVPARVQPVRLQTGDPASGDGFSGQPADRNGWGGGACVAGAGMHPEGCP